MFLFHDALMHFFTDDQLSDQREVERLSLNLPDRVGLLAEAL